MIPNIWPPSALSLMWTEFGRNCVPADNESAFAAALAIPYPQDKNRS